jgi:hypothetical protein
MLLSTPTTASAARPSIQITIPYTTQSNTVMYTVPVGRKFIGYIACTGNGPQTFINTMAFHCYQGANTAVVQAGALNAITLLAGTVVKEGSSANVSYMYGVESDA